MIVSRMAQAHARVEGWFDPNPPSHPNRPQRNNNPGDLEYGPFAISHGAIRGDPRFAVFPTAKQGWVALDDLLLTKGYRDTTITTDVERFAPASENNVQVYINKLCLYLGAKPNDPISLYSLGGRFE